MNQSKAPFDLIQPGTAGWGEVEMEATPFLRLPPLLHLRALVRAIVVQDQVNLQIGWNWAFEVIQKADKLAAPRPRLTGANNLPIQDVESGQPGSRTVPLIIVGWAFGQARPQRKNGRGAIPCLNLALFV